MSRIKIVNIVRIILVIILMGATTLPRAAAANNSRGNECKADSDCQYLFNSCPNWPELCPPRWGAFCVNRTCQLSHNRYLPLPEQWIQTCEAHKARGLNKDTLKECFQNAAYASLHKSSDADVYTVVYEQALQICDKYLGEKSGQCKLNVCQNLHLGDGNIKYNYPEEQDCKQKVIRVCPNGSIIDNIPCACNPRASLYTAYDKDWLENYNKYRKGDTPIYCCAGKQQDTPCK